MSPFTNTRSTSLVVFETLYKDGKELAVHADIEDENQTVKVKIPEIGTKATVDGKKEVTAFMQTTLLFLGLMTFPNNMLLGLGIMLAANEVPRIAQQFGLDSSVRVNMMSVVHATTTAVNLTRSVAKAAGK